MGAVTPLAGGLWFDSQYPHESPEVGAHEFMQASTRKHTLKQAPLNGPFCDAFCLTQKVLRVAWHLLRLQHERALGCEAFLSLLVVMILTLRSC